MKRFDVVTEFRTYNNCYLVVRGYAVDGSLGIGIDTLIRCISGFCEYPVYIFNLEKIKEYTK